MEADAVLVYPRELPGGASAIPKVRKPGQRWVFWAPEAPAYTFDSPSYSERNLSKYDGIFDLTYNFMSHSDIYEPYGHIPINKNR